MDSRKYEALEQNIGFVDDLRSIEKTHDHLSSIKRYSFSKSVLATFLVFSIFLNVLHYTSNLTWNREYKIERTYAGLTRDMPTTIIHDNRTIDDAVWTDAWHLAETGMIAVDDDFVQRNGLLPAQRYPWDPSKSIYLLHGYHSLHCVLVFRDLVMEVRDGRPSSRPHDHLVHCLHTLREDVECSADDFPQYTGRLNAEKHHIVTNPGVGDVRMCRSWDRLREFALANTACWNGTGQLQSQYPLDYYKHCPDGSKPWEALGS